MRHAALMIGILALSAPLPIFAAEDPLAPARDGKLQCYSPDVVHKTCRALAGYQFGADGQIMNPAAVLVAPEPITVMTVVTPVALESGAVCGRASATDIDNAGILIGGKPVEGEQAQAFKAQIKSAISARMGKEICTTYVPNGDHLAAHVTVDGAEHPELSADVMWVSQADGYQVAPGVAATP